MMDTPADVHVVALRPEEAADVQALAEECAQYFLETFGRAPAADEGPSLFTELPPGAKYADKAVAGARDRDGRLVAVADIVRDWPDEETWTIGLVLVVPDMRRLGIGSAIVEGIALEARRAGASRLRLAVYVDRLEAVSFWEHHRFETAGLQLRETELGERELLVMVRDLGGAAEA